jgi:hypothetical protein
MRHGATPPHAPRPTRQHASFRTQRSDDRSIQINRVLGPPLHTASRYPGRAHRRLSSACLCVPCCIIAPVLSHTSIRTCTMPDANPSTCISHKRSPTRSIAPLNLISSATAAAAAAAASAALVPHSHLASHARSGHDAAARCAPSGSAAASVPSARWSHRPSPPLCAY